jgi:hypothetical protein
MKRFEVNLYDDVHGHCSIAIWLRELDQQTNKQVDAKESL